ncbi:hypothetical protein ASPCAL07753 [Aspergillus calidoustus]|uniref:Xylanolytic transcriptional activator regulatory domain-containing protein n=1 Tax=Aspergillus calidoustus TaxID=454130 RepID=A0A0U5GPM2_ASPCI|nr:hypothetical protein ASPCAL07753 [Aspergillus calidoustus]
MTTTLTPLSLGTGDSVLATVGGREPALAHRRVITLLLDVYLDSIHPKFPLFCERELWVGWREGSFPQDDSDFMSLMCLCALSAQHVGDGALFNDNVDAPERTNLREAYIAEATRLVPIDFDKSDLNLVRSFTFLALLGAQTGNNATLHKYLGLCHGISAHLSLQDESRWPAMLSPCEVEVRRRLWWSIYRLEVHTACVLGNIVRTSETRCAVGYPAGAHHPAFIPGRNGQFEDWFDGWNMTTDLYRVLEHAVSDLRAKHSPAHSILGRMGGSDPTALMTRLSEIQERLLPQFVTPASRSEDSGRNRCGFQAPSIICTIHLARLLSRMSSNGDPLLACQVATDLIASIMAIPLEYIRAAGSPLIQQLAGVGHILVGTAKKHQLLQEHYAQVKQVIHSITSLLDLLATPNTIASSTRDRLVNLVSELEDVYATTTANAKVNTVDEGHILHWLQDVEEPTLGQAAFPNELLTDFTWLYPAYP